MDPTLALSPAVLWVVMTGLDFYNAHHNLRAWYTHDMLPARNCGFLQVDHLNEVILPNSGLNKASSTSMNESSTAPKEL